MGQEAEENAEGHQEVVEDSVEGHPEAAEEDQDEILVEADVPAVAEEEVMAAVEREDQAVDQENQHTKVVKEMIGEAEKLRAFSL